MVRNISVCKTRLRYTRMNAEEKKRQLKAGDEMNSLVLQMQTSDTPNDSKLDCVRFFRCSFSICFFGSCSSFSHFVNILKQNATRYHQSCRTMAKMQQSCVGVWTVCLLFTETDRTIISGHHHVQNARRQYSKGVSPRCLFGAKNYLIAIQTEHLIKQQLRVFFCSIACLFFQCFQQIHYFIISLPFVSVFKFNSWLLLSLLSLCSALEIWYWRYVFINLIASWNLDIVFICLCLFLLYS